MQTVRRVYLYLVSAVSLIGVSWAVIGLVRLIISEGIGQGQIIGLASWLAVIIVGLPIFLFHWPIKTPKNGIQLFGEFSCTVFWPPVLPRSSAISIAWWTMRC